MVITMNFAELTAFVKTNKNYMNMIKEMFGEDFPELEKAISVYDKFGDADDAIGWLKTCHINGLSVDTETELVVFDLPEKLFVDICGFYDVAISHIDKWYKRYKVIFKPVVTKLIDLGKAAYAEAVSIFKSTCEADDTKAALDELEDELNDDPAMSEFVEEWDCYFIDKENR